MTDKDTSQGDESEDDDWMSYANAGFGTTDYSLWDDGGQEAEFVVEPDWDEEDLQLDTGEEEIPPAPNLLVLSTLLGLVPVTTAWVEFRERKDLDRQFTNLESKSEIR